MACVALSLPDHGFLIVSAEDADFVQGLLDKKKIKWSPEGPRLAGVNHAPFLARLIIERATGAPIPEKHQVRRQNLNKFDVRRENLRVVATKPRAYRRQKLAEPALVY